MVAKMKNGHDLPAVKPTRSAIARALIASIAYMNRAIAEECLRGTSPRNFMWMMLVLCEQIDEGGHYVRFADLQAALGRSQAATSRLVEWAREAGFVMTDADPDDGRATVVWPTAKGKRLISGLVRAMRAAVIAEGKRQGASPI